MVIPATDIQILELVADGRVQEGEDVILTYDGGWHWETSTSSWPATDAQAADALLERVLVLESEVMDLQHRAQLGDALTQALQATEILEMSGSPGFQYEVDGDWVVPSTTTGLANTVSR
jgi:hypothetical protein